MLSPPAQTLLCYLLGTLMEQQREAAATVLQLSVRLRPSVQTNVVQTIENPGRLERQQSSGSSRQPAVGTSLFLSSCPGPD